MSAEQLLEIYRHMAASRRTDRLQAAAAQRGEVFFYIPSSGHEAVAALAPHLRPADWLHLHYRDRALAYARGIAPETVFLGLFGKAGSNSEGRRMPAFPCDRTLNVLSTPTLVGDNALQSVGVAASVKDAPDAPIVLCAVGDGATQQGDFHEAVAEAVRSRLPVLFLVEDNRLALSTPTAEQTFHSLPSGDAPTHYGLPILRIDGADAAGACERFGEIVGKMRETRAPQLVVLQVERLESHTNADDHTVYRSEEEIRSMRETGDPVANLRAELLAAGISPERLDALDAEIEKTIEAAFHAARKASPPKPIFSAKKPLPAPKPEYRGTPENRSLTLLEAMRETLRARLKRDERVSLYGQDIEDPKGDVFGLTRGLGDEFPQRVRNAPLAENTILGVSTGRALAGERPVACIQFADFIPVAYNHLASEIGPMWWRTNGQWEAPVLVLSICGGYRPGLGPYHAQTNESLCAHVPGIDVFMPSDATDAAGLLNAVFEAGRPAVFLFPKSLVNDRDRLASPDVERLYVPIGKARTVRAGNDLTLVAWGGVMPLCERAAETLADVGANVEILDLRTLSPWDEDAVLASVRKTGRLVVVHEDNQTAGIGAEIAAVVAEKAPGTEIVRVVRPDVPIPYDFSCQIEILPSFRRVLETCCDLLDVELRWERDEEETDGTVVVKAIGSSPSDETIVVTRLAVRPGDAVAEGDLLAAVEADKATMDITSPVAGVVEELLAEEGDSLSVGTPFVRIAAEEAEWSRPLVEENPGTPVLLRRRATEPRVATHTDAREPDAPTAVYLSNVCTVLGSRHLANDELLESHHEWDSEAIRRRTGIENRYWIDGDETVETLAVSAARKLLETEGLDVSEIGAIVCSTGTPLQMTPSLACTVLHELSPKKGEVLMQAHDVNAACSGYLYALQSAYDFLGNDPGAKVLVITAETLSPMLNHDDQKTLALFGDAATATLVSCEPRPGNLHVRLDRPVLSATGVDKKVLYVPNVGAGEVIEMEGLTVFKLAVRKMIDMLDDACGRRGIAVEDLWRIVPHQANERIIEAIRKTIHCPPERMFNHIRKYGNTSSNTIPFALSELLPETKAGKLVGLTAFGGGFTFGAAVLEKLGK